MNQEVKDFLYTRWYAIRDYDYWSMIDLSDNMLRVKSGIRNAKGAIAVVFGLLSVFIAVQLSAFVWAFDVSPTYAWAIGTENFMKGVMGASLFAFTTLTISFLPTALELGATPIARAGVFTIQSLIFACMAFDAYTDMPVAWAFCELQKPFFTWAGVLADPFWFIFFLFWMFLSTIGFELATILFIYAAYILLWIQAGQKDDRVITVEAKSTSNRSGNSKGVDFGNAMNGSERQQRSNQNNQHPHANTHTQASF